MALCFDWLCINVKEDSLPEKFSGRKLKEFEIIDWGTDTLDGGMKAEELTKLNNYRAKVIERFHSYGFPRTECMEAMQDADDNATSALLLLFEWFCVGDSLSSGKVEQILFGRLSTANVITNASAINAAKSMFPSLSGTGIATSSSVGANAGSKEKKGGKIKSTAPDAATLLETQMRELRQEEECALEAIYEHGLQRDDEMSILSIKIPLPIGNSRIAAGSNDVVLPALYLDVWADNMYPSTNPLFCISERPLNCEETTDAEKIAENASTNTSETDAIGVGASRGVGSSGGRGGRGGRVGRGGSTNMVSQASLIKPAPLTSQSKLAIMKALAIESKTYEGNPMIHDIVVWASEHAKSLVSSVSTNKSEVIADESRRNRTSGTDVKYSSSFLNISTNAVVASSKTSKKNEKSNLSKEEKTLEKEEQDEMRRRKKAKEQQIEREKDKEKEKQTQSKKSASEGNDLNKLFANDATSRGGIKITERNKASEKFYSKFSAISQQSVQLEMEKEEELKAERIKQMKELLYKDELQRLRAAGLLTAEDELKHAERERLMRESDRQGKQDAEPVQSSNEDQDMIEAFNKQSKLMNGTSDFKKFKKQADKARADALEEQRIQLAQQARALKTSSSEYAVKSEMLLKQWNAQKLTKGYLDKLPVRENLPATLMKQQLIDVVNKHQVVVVSGATGCGTLICENFRIHLLINMYLCCNICRLFR
jgi:hypothetical protein